MALKPIHILGDIGGTNLRLALTDGENILCCQIYENRKYATLTEAVSQFLLEKCSQQKPVKAAFALAAPVLGNIVKLTNANLICDQLAIQKAFGLEQVMFVNDFAAIAYALKSLKKSDITVIQQGSPINDFPMLVMGPGTGLGISALVPYQGGYRAVPTEAGHVRYAPANANERQIVETIAHEQIFVSNEHLISGPGLVNIYKALCLMADKAERVNLGLQPATIVERARQGEKIAKQSLHEFSAIFGSIASQFALSFAALGGIYLTGGVLNKIGPDFEEQTFLDRFNTNPDMSDLLQRIPISRVNSEIPAFNGLMLLVK